MTDFMNSQKNGGESGGLIQVRDPTEIFSEDIDFQIAGTGFDLAHSVKALGPLVEYLANTSSKKSLPSVVHTHTLNGEVVQVIGGGESEWVAVVLKSTRKAKSGESLFLSE